MTAPLGNYGSILVHSSPIEETAEPVIPPHRSVPSFLGAVAVSLLGLVALLIHQHQSGDVKIISLSAETTPALYSARRKEDIPHFFQQTVDHYNESNTDTWEHRYYIQAKYFGGPGCPIILVFGGEGGNDDGMFYPFVNKYLASTFQALVLHPEHRFYGRYRPTNDTSTDVLLKLLTPDQAIQDMLSIVKHYRKELGCSFDRSSKDYCPLLTVGGSYPGFLAASMRLLYPDIVDIGYGSSAPIKLFAREADQFGYYDIVTASAERASTGCADAVRNTLNEVNEVIQNSLDFGIVAEKLNICKSSIPAYIGSNDMFSKEIIQLIAVTFADLNMFNYNKDPSRTELAKRCRLFQDKSLNSYEKLAVFWTKLSDNPGQKGSCFDLSSQLPDGPNARISGADWSGVGPGSDGMMFDFQCCTLLTPEIGFSDKSMFPYRKFTLEWLTKHCMSRFGVVPRPDELVEEWKFDDFVGQGASRILLTNGLNDMWSAGSYLHNLSDSIIAINMPNGAHHSELKHTNAQNMDTPDVMKAHEDITEVLAGWLKEVRAEQKE